jgi:hypothetical protein
MEAPAKFPRRNFVVEASSAQLEVVLAILLIEVVSKGPLVSLKVSVLEHDELIPSNAFFAPSMENVTVCVSVSCISSRPWCSIERRMT